MTKTPGTKGDCDTVCHCVCHYREDVRHCAPCCNKTYEQYDPSIWKREAVERHLMDARRIDDPSPNTVALMELWEEWLTKPE